jgi:hypothetical protein
MDAIKIISIDKDFLVFEANNMRGGASLAWDIRDIFMNTPGIASFEVSPFSGSVFIGFERFSKQSDEGRAVLALLQEHFPELTSSMHFQRWLTGRRNSPLGRSRGSVIETQVQAP